jgi:YjbR
MMANSERIRTLALSLPSTYEDSPWGFPVFKAGDNKLFAMMTDHDGECELTVKLTDDERDIAMQLPHVRGELRRTLRLGDRARFGRRIAAIGARVVARELLAESAETPPRCCVRRMTIRRLAPGDESVLATLATYRPLDDGDARALLADDDTIQLVAFDGRSVGGRDEGDNVVWEFDYTAP